MSGGKACDKQAAQYTGKQPDDGGAVTSRDTAAAENEEHSSGDTHINSMRLDEMSAAKEAGGKGEAEEGKQPAAREQRTCTTRQATQTQPALLAELQALLLTHREATRLFLMAASQGATDAQIADALRQGLPHLTDPASLQDQSFGKQPQGIGVQAEQGKKGYEQKKRTCTTSQATQTQPLLLAADAFAAALEAIPAEDWSRTWAAGRTIMLRRTSKRVKEVVDKMRLPAVVRLSRCFWNDARNGTYAEKLQLVMRQLTLMTGWCRISSLELPLCGMKGQDAEILAGVLAQCPALAHLDLSGNPNVGPAGAERLAGVLPQCAALTHLNLGNNDIDDAGTESLAGVMAQCQALASLNLGYNRIGPAGAERLAGVLGQCPALAHLDLSYNDIGAAGAESLAGVLAQCTALAHLDLQYNGIGTVGKGRLRASWRGQATGIVFVEEEDDDDEDEEGEEDDDEVYDGLDDDEDEDEV
jgi:hypothetical protein